MRKRRLFTPGPTPLLPEAQLAMARPVIHHRSAEFRELFLSTRENLQKIFKTSGDIVILTASGSGAMEAAAGNLFSPQDQVLAVVAGKFGERWSDICRAFEIPCDSLIKEAGSAASAEEITEAVRRNPSVAGVLLQGCETSTATSHDVEAIARELRREFPEVLLVVDGITAIGSQPIETDKWGLDVVISGSQKSFAMSPGLAFLSLSPRALERMEKNSRRGFYFDLLKEVKAQRQGQTAYTPSVSLVEALYESTRVILEQGVDAVVTEAAQMARCTRAGLEALGFRLLSSRPANAATGAFPPAGISAAELSKQLEHRFGLKVAGGQGELKNKIIRIAHLGYFDVLDVFSLLAALELCLLESGHPFEPGSSISAAMAQLGSSDETTAAVGTQA